VVAWRRDGGPGPGACAGRGARAHLCMRGRGSRTGPSDRADDAGAAPDRQDRSVPPDATVSAEQPWSAARLLWTLEPGVAHLNHGSFGAVPLPVQRAQQRLRDEAEANPTKFHSRGLMDRLAHVRRYLASFLGADPDRTAFVPNASAGVSAVLASLPLRADDEVLLTDHAYGAVLLAVERACELSGARPVVRPIPLGAAPDEVVAEVSEGIGPRT
jgi:isopenicillin-N epimerase